MSFNFSEKSSSPVLEFDFLDGAKVKLRTLTGEAQRDFIRKTTVTKARVERVEEKPGVFVDKVFTYPERDEFLYTDLIIDFCIAGWSGITDNGKEVPCNYESKRTLFWNSDEFMTFFYKSIAELSKAQAKQEEDASKNL
jgi:hypothetical protein